MPQSIAGNRGQPSFVLVKPQTNALRPITAMEHMDIQPPRPSIKYIPATLK